MRRDLKPASVATVLVTLMVSSCGELRDLPTAPTDPEPDPSATLQRVQREVFTPSCTSIGCHDTLGQQQGLVLVEGRSYEMLVGRASTQLPAILRVQPGAPLESYLYRKLTGGAIVGERMPAGSPPLSDVHLRLVRDWIRRGAPDD